MAAEIKNKGFVHKMQKKNIDYHTFANVCRYDVDLCINIIHSNYDLSKQDVVNHHSLAPSRIERIKRAAESPASPVNLKIVSRVNSQSWL